MKQYKSMIFVLVMMIAVLIVSTAAVDAQSASIPAYTITSVTAGLEVTVQTKDFPASTDFVVRMRDFDAGGNAMSVARFNSGAGGAFGLALPIPSEVAGARTIEMTIVSASDPFGSVSRRSSRTAGQAVKSAATTASFRRLISTRSRKTGASRLRPLNFRRIRRSRLRWA